MTDEPDPGILVDSQILKARASGLLAINPFDEESLEPASYDLGVGDVAVVSTASQPIDLREHPLLTLEPFASAMFQTEEILELSPKIAGRLGPRSNLLRHGIFVSTGPQIDPGFRGRLFVNLFNVTDHPFLIRHRSRFLTVEFHALSVAPRKSYTGPHQGRTEFTDEQINAILGRGGASLKEVQRALLEIQGPLRIAATLGQELPGFVETQQQLFQRATDIMGTLKTATINQTGSIVVPITTLGAGPYQLARDLPIVVQPIEGGYTATFFDANASMSGETQEEAVENLKSYLVDLLEDLESESPEQLGPEPARQLVALRALIRRVG